MAFVEAGGLRIAYVREGSGRPIVFVHGFFGDHRVWRRQLDLADEYTFVAWDAPGCGTSSMAPDSFRMPDYADLLAAFITRVDLERPPGRQLFRGNACASVGKPASGDR